MTNTSGSTPPPQAPDPNKAYGADEVAKFIGKTKTEVEELWANWTAGETPKMNFNTQTGRGPARVSTGGHINEYLKKYGTKP